MLTKISKNEIDPKCIREKMLEFEAEFAKVPGAKFNDDCAPLKHTFVDGAYIREITMPKGWIFTSKIHKIEHPYFVMKGDCSVLTEEGMVRIKAPHWGVTKPGTKRVLYMHEETIWATVHSNPTNTKNLEEIEEQLIAPSFECFGEMLLQNKEEELCHGE